MMIPELLEGQRYVCTYRLSQDHLELFFQFHQGLRWMEQQSNCCSLPELFPGALWSAVALLQEDRQRSSTG
ncbi:hypothetical protein UPYG_G00022530 [Umbra pygmaea]|uniref:Uncharacterized protein n=1 Tax=Umbra pygmaea TaxID=75934 RepID=A0ABD0Y552_UMBPY